MSELFTDPIFEFKFLPIPPHEGILVSPKIRAMYSMAEISSFLKCKKNLKDNENFMGVSMVIIDELDDDIICLVSWYCNGNKFELVIFGSEL